MGGILWAVAVVLIVMWLLGFAFHLFTFMAGGLIHILLVAAVVVIIVNLLMGRRAV